MKTFKFLIFLCTGLFLLGFANSASALPLTLDVTKIGKKSFYDNADNYKLDLEAETKGLDLSWEFDVKVKKGVLDDDEFKFSYNGSRKIKGHFFSFEVTPTDTKGQYTFKGQMIFESYEFDWLENQEEIFFLGSFTANSAPSNIEGHINGGANPVPEPATMLLLGIGLLGLAGIGRRRIKK